MQGGEEWKINNENDYDHVWINGGNNQEILQVKNYINSLNCHEKFHKFSAMCQLKSVPNPFPLLYQLHFCVAIDMNILILYFRSL